jgi:protein tyrosine phosphatase
MSKIQNVSLIDFLAGDHIPAKYAIRIVDEDNLFTLKEWKNQSSFNPENVLSLIFSDVNQNDTGFINNIQAEKIISLLTKALEDKTDVIVHCVMGVSRSGAVAQFAIDFLGFEDGSKNITGSGRVHKNTDVYNTLRKQAGFLFSFE